MCKLDHSEYWALNNWWFWIVVLEKTLERSNQSIPKEINSEYSLEGLMLKLQCFGHLIRRASSLEKTLVLGKIEGRRRKWTTEDEMVGWHHWLNGHEFHYQETVKDRGAWCAAVLGVAKSWTQLSDWTTKKYILVTWVTKDIHTYISYKWQYHNHTLKRKKCKNWCNRNKISSSISNIVPMSVSWLWCCALIR